MYAILRTDKLSTWKSLAGVAGHHARTRETLNANPAVGNHWLVGAPEINIVDTVRTLIGNRKIRKNAVLAIEVVLTASPEYFRPNAPEAAGQYEPDRLAAFEVQALDWLRRTFGPSNIASAVTHLDESSPHIQAVITPIDPSTDRLNASLWLDGPPKLRALQDSFGAACRPLGLERGIRGSKATHMRVSQYYGTVNGAVPPSMPDPEVCTPPHMFSTAARESWAEGESHRLQAEQHAALQPVTDAAASVQTMRRKLQEAERTARSLSAKLERLRRDADQARDIPMAQVLRAAGYIEQGEGEWTGPAGCIRITTNAGKEQFASTTHGNRARGTGAIDLAMYLHGLDARDAVIWLAREVDRHAAVGAAMSHARQAARDAIKSARRLNLKDWSVQPTNADAPTPTPSQEDIFEFRNNS